MYVKQHLADKVNRRNPNAQVTENNLSDMNGAQQGTVHFYFPN